MKTRVNDLLNHKTREDIFRFIQINPGVHLRGLQRHLNLPLSTIDHHTKVLCSNSLLCRYRDGKYSRFYAGKIDEEAHLIVSALRKKRKKEIIATILSRDYTTFQDMVECIRVNDSTLSYHLGGLVDDGIIYKEKVGKEYCYFLNKRDDVSHLLAKIRSLDY